MSTPPLPPDTPPPYTPESSDPTIITPRSSPMDPVIVLVVAIFFAPVAYFLYGQIQKGIGAIVLYIALIVISVLTCGVGAALFAPAHVLIIVDAYMQAKLLKDGRAIRQWSFFTQGA